MFAALAGYKEQSYYDQYPSTCSYEFENARFVGHGVLRPLSN